MARLYEPGLARMVLALYHATASFVPVAAACACTGAMPQQHAASPSCSRRCPRTTPEVLVEPSRAALRRGSEVCASSSRESPLCRPSSRSSPLTRTSPRRPSDGGLQTRNRRPRRGQRSAAGRARLRRRTSQWSLQCLPHRSPSGLCQGSWYLAHPRNQGGQRGH